jgi:hypothetical protein
LAVVEGELMKISAGCFAAAGAGCAAMFIGSKGAGRIRRSIVVAAVWSSVA